MLTYIAPRAADLVCGVNTAKEISMSNMNQDSDKSQGQPGRNPNQSGQQNQGGKPGQGGQQNQGQRDKGGSGQQGGGQQSGGDKSNPNRKEI